MAVMAQGMSGASAGIITGVLTNPMDIVRTKAQTYTQYGARDTVKYILKTDGPMGLMTGLSAVRCNSNLMRLQALCVCVQG